MKNVFLMVLLIICISCISTNHPKWFCSKKIACKKHLILEKPIKINLDEGFNNSPTNYKYDDFPYEDGKSYILYGEQFAEGGQRFGRIINGKKQSKWLSGDADFDDKGNVYAKGGIWREEYFKNGLRDSIYKRFDNNGKIIYETTFKQGTGLWKEFHSNGELYF